MTDATQNTTPTPPESRQALAPAHGSATTDTQRLDWLERNLILLTHNRATSSVSMDGRQVHGQLYNEARGRDGGPSFFRVNHRNIREAIDAAMQWPNVESSATGGAKGTQ